MNGLDIALIVIFAYFFLRGILRGVLKETVAFIGLFIAFWVSSIYWPILSKQLVQFIDNETYRAIISFIGIYLIVYFLISLISIFIDKIIKWGPSAFLSGFLGGIVGVLKGTILSAIILISLQAFIPSNNPLYQESVLWPYAKPVCNTVKQFFPKAIQGLLSTKPGQFIQNVVQNAQNNLKLSINEIDFNKLRELLNNYPDLINSKWREKIKAMKTSSDLTYDDIKQFVKEHPNLFGSYITGSIEEPQETAPSAPNWARPAE